MGRSSPGTLRPRRTSCSGNGWWRCSRPPVGRGLPRRGEAPALPPCGVMPGAPHLLPLSRCALRSRSRAPGDLTHAPPPSGVASNNARPTALLRSAYPRSLLLLTLGRPRSERRQPRRAALVSAVRDAPLSQCLRDPAPPKLASRASRRGFDSLEPNTAPLPCQARKLTINQAPPRRPLDVPAFVTK